MTAGTAAPVAPQAAPAPSPGSMVTLPLPSGPSGGGNVLFTSGFSIPTSCDNIPTAAAFVDFRMHDDAGAEAFPRGERRRHLQQQLDDPNLPATKRAELGLYQRIVAQNPVSVLYPPGYQAGFEGAFVRAYESVVFGGTPTRDAARAFMTEVNAALAGS